MLMVVFLTANAGAQSRTWPDHWGDSLVAITMRQTIQAIYARQARTVTVHSEVNLLGGFSGEPTDVDGRYASDSGSSSEPGHVIRVVATSRTTFGAYSVEYYFQHDSLLFMYDTFVYAQGHAKDGQWQNFRHEPAWERRVYWRRDSIAYVESFGRDAAMPPAEPQILLERATQLRQLIERQVSQQP